jgi:hypothetical protein
VDFNTDGLTNGTYMINGLKDGKKQNLQVVKQYIDCHKRSLRKQLLLLNFNHTLL